MNYINSQDKLSTLDTFTTSDWSVRLELTTQQNIILNATLNCIEALTGEMANTARMINRLASLDLVSVEASKQCESINVMFGLDKYSGKVSYIRLGRKEVSGRWFIYTTCIFALGLPVSTGTQMQVRSDSQITR